MFKLLVKFFIKDSENVANPAVREKYGILCGAIGVFFNLLLASCKLAAGFVIKSVAITADGMNHLSDSVSSMVTLVGFKISAKAPDKKHPFGHGRFEYVAGLIVSLLIFLMGAEVLKTSALSVVHPSQIKPDLFTSVVLIFSIFTKAYMYMYNHYVAKKIDSETMEAAARDSFSDVLTTLVVLLSMVVSLFASIPWLDGVAGCIVALFILKSGWDSINDTLAPMLGKVPPAAFIQKIERIVLAYDPVRAVHDIIVHDYGPSHIMITLHAEVPADRNIFELHNAIDKAETALSKEFNCSALIHMDPIDFKSEKNVAVRSLLPKIAESLNAGISVHDVRCIPEKEETKVIFDVSKPYDCKLSDDEIHNFISIKLQERYPDCTCAMTIEHPFI